MAKSGGVPVVVMLNLFALSESEISTLVLPLLLVNTGVSLPYLSIKTTPAWYVLIDFTEGFGNPILVGSATPS